MSRSVFLALYGLVWKMARPFLRRSRRLADGWDSRLVPEGWADPCDVWIQAASGGEAYLADELLRQFPKRPEPLRVLVTTWTRQGMDVLEKTCSHLAETRPDLIIQKAFFPFDEPALMRRALAMTSPRAVMLLETELWPSLLSACAEKHTPVLIANGRITESSFKGYGKLRRFAPGFWRDAAPKCVGALSQEDADRFAALFSTAEIKVIPNIKFDRARTNMTPDISVAAPLLPNTQTRLCLLASVREEEEQLLLPAVRGMRQDEGQTLIIAPRHLHRVEAWVKGLTDAGITPVLRSALTPDAPALAGSVIVWDTFGELMSLYALCGSVFVGGSLAPLGGQNMLEPLACGRIPCVGPYTKNFSWAMDGKNGLAADGLAHVCPDAASIMEVLTQPGESPENVKRRFGAWLAPRRGGTAQNIAMLLPYLG